MPHAYKYQKEFVNSLGGCDIILDVLLKKDLLPFINKKLGKRNSRAEYSYGEGIIMWFLALCSGARRIEHVYNHKDRFKRNPRFNKFISPDTLLYMFKQLAEDNKEFQKGTYYKEKNSITASHQVNYNEKLNDLLVTMALKLGLLKKGFKYVLEYDTTILENKIKDSRVHYKNNGRKGYTPALAVINNIPLIVENRNGDSNPAFNTYETVKGIIEYLGSKGIEVSTTRIDGVGYNKDLIEYLNLKNIKFFTRARIEKVRDLSSDIFSWQEEIVVNDKLQIADTRFMFGTSDTRMILYKPTDDTTLGIATNDFDMGNKEAILFYRQRGDTENVFKYLKGDFGWDIMPMRDIRHNTVYLCIQALCFQLYTYLIRKFAGVVNFVRNNMRLPTFINEFMRVPTMWRGNDLVFLVLDKDYTGLAGFT